MSSAHDGSSSVPHCGHMSIGRCGRCHDHVSKDKVEREIVIRASIARVFAALTDPSMYPTWGPERVGGKLEPGERPILDFGEAGRPRSMSWRSKLRGTSRIAGFSRLTSPIRSAIRCRGQTRSSSFACRSNAEGTRVTVTDSGLSKLPGLPPSIVEEILGHMGKGWELMLDGLARRASRSGPRRG
jgi:hypothetical protein